MPKPPETKRARRAGLIAVAAGALAASALGGFYIWPGTRNAPAQSDSPLDGLAAALSSAQRALTEALSSRAEQTPADAPAPGSMQASLLETSDGDRNHLFRRAIADAGFECSEIRTAGAIGRTGSAWRANCGEANLYLIGVDEFGRLSVFPMPYGDLQFLEQRTITISPEDQAPRLQFREPE